MTAYAVWPSSVIEREDWCPETATRSSALEPCQKLYQSSNAKMIIHDEELPVGECPFQRQGLRIDLLPSSPY